MTFRIDPGALPGPWFVIVINIITVLTFANSMLNPFLYAFLSDNFRKSFAKAFKCTTLTEMNRSLCHDNSLFPRTSQTYGGKSQPMTTTMDERIELSTMDTNVNSTCHVMCEENSTAIQDEKGHLKPVAL